MSEKTITEVLDDLYKINKILRQFERRYGAHSTWVFFMYKYKNKLYSPEEADFYTTQAHIYAQDANFYATHVESFNQWAQLYETKLDNQYMLAKLSRQGIHELHEAAKGKKLIAIKPDEILPISIAFLCLNHNLVWLEEVGPWLTEGLWLEEEEPWLNKEQWPEAKGHWYFFIGDRLLFTGNTRGELIAFVFGMAFAEAATLSDEEFKQIETYLSQL